MPSSASRAGECRKRPALHRRKTPRSRHAKEGGTSLKDGEACPSCLAHGRMPEVASDTLAEKPSSALRAGGRCILKKRKRSLPHTSRVEDRFQQTALHRGKSPCPRYARERYIPKRWRSLPSSTSCAGGRGRCLWRGNPAWFQARWNGAAALVRRCAHRRGEAAFCASALRRRLPLPPVGQGGAFRPAQCSPPGNFAGGKQGNSAFSQKTTCQAGCTSCMLVSEES